MNFNKAGKYLSLILLVLAIFSISIGVSVAAGENSSSTQTVDFNNHISYSNSSHAVNVDYKSTHNLENDLTNSNIGGISFSLSNHTDSDEDSFQDIFALSNENPVNANASHALSYKSNSILTNVSQAFSEQLFNTSNLLTNNTLNFAEENTNQLNENLSKVLDDINWINNSNGLYKNFIFTNMGFDSEFVTFLVNYNKLINTGSESFIVKQKNNNNNNKRSNELNTFSFDSDWDELTELEFGSHNFTASKLLISNHVKEHIYIYIYNDTNTSLNKKVQKNLNFGHFNKNLLDNFSTVDLYKNKYTFFNENQIKNKNSYFFIFNNSKNNNSKIYADKLSIPESYSSDDNDNDEDEPSDSIDLGNRFIFYFNFFETSSEFYEILDNAKFYGNLIPLNASAFHMLDSYLLLIQTVFLMNNSKSYANELSIPENCSSDYNDEDQLSNLINLGNGFIFYFNFFETSNEFYEILDNNKSCGKLISLKSSNFNTLGSYSITDYFSNEIKNKYALFNENQIKNNNSLFYISNNSKNNSKIYADKLSIPENCSSDDDNNDEDEPSDSINLGNRFIFYFNSFETSNEFYKILDNTKFYGNLTPSETSIFDILESYSTNRDYFSNGIVSFEIVDIRNDSINFGIITDYSKYLLNTDYSSFLNFNNHVINSVLLYLLF
ncbi:hypothetical protein [Methanobrevibacter curvatus]|uniref:Uncharacterized protein n=1 Tax=Methanobrevibacter curvatus TaxID=49547 RepID=A0A166CD85_9EURY|nr:hypothetical protein [Methanobrevibacter curvatus]KZX14386.1 hypothetical protein MBCUR_05050 [Methanobrevibacter curvatus]